MILCAVHHVLHIIARGDNVWAISESRRALGRGWCQELQMRLNESTVLLGPRVRLVPYRRAHVLRYNQWMQDPELASCSPTSAGT